MLIMPMLRAGISASISAAATVIERLISFWMTTFIGLIFLSMFGTSVLDKAFALVGSNKDDKKDTKSIEESSKEDEIIDDADSNEEKAPLEIWKEALAKVTPQVEVKSRRIGGATFQVPTEIRADRKEF